jgi:hypothetical protein
VAKILEKERSKRQIEGGKILEKEGRTENSGGRTENKGESLFLRGVKLGQNRRKKEEKGGRREEQSSDREGRNGPNREGKQTGGGEEDFEDR